MLDVYIRRHDPDCLERLQKKGVIQDRFNLTKPEQKLLLHIRDNNCRCPMWARGTNEYGVSYLPFSLKCRSWKAAEDKIKEFKQPPAKSGSGEKLSIADAITRWEASLASAEKGSGTIYCYVRAAKLMAEFLAKKNITEVAQIEPHHLELLMIEWKGLKRNTRRNRKSWVATFFHYCRRMWPKVVVSVPTDALDPVRRARPDKDEEPEEATLPLDPDGGDKNFQKIRAAIRPLLAGEFPSQGGKRGLPKTSPIGKRPDHLIAIADLMKETGLRVCDTAFFDVDAMIVGPRYATYETIQIKTGHPIEVSIPLELAKRVQKLERISPRYVFLTSDCTKEGDGRKKARHYINGNIYQYLRAAGEAVGIEGVRPHRFRDSFALDRLLEGLDMHELQVLLGHRSLRTTERYYAPLVKGRKSRIADRAMAARLGGKKPSNVVVIPVTRKRRAS